MLKPKERAEPRERKSVLCDGEGSSEYSPLNWTRAHTEYSFSISFTYKWSMRIGKYTEHLPLPPHAGSSETKQFSLIQCFVPTGVRGVEYRPRNDLAPSWTTDIWYYPRLCGFLQIPLLALLSPMFQNKVSENYFIHDIIAKTWYISPDWNKFQVCVIIMWHQSS